MQPSWNSKSALKYLVKIIWIVNLLETKMIQGELSAKYDILNAQYNQK